MKTIGEKIAQLRKEKGMTQDALAEVIGVSSQTISKWETNTTMPDIMILPVIAGVFEISIDEIFSINKPIQQKIFPYEETPSAVYNEILNTMWQSEGTDVADNVRKNLSEYPDQSSGFVSKVGGGVYANRDIALAFLPDDKQASSLLDNQKVAELLLVLADRTVRALLKYQAEDSGRSFTSASVSAKMGLPEDNVTEALDKLVRFHLTSVQTVDIGFEEKLKIYQMNGPHKMILLVYPLLSLA